MRVLIKIPTFFSELDEEMFYNALLVITGKPVIGIDKKYSICIGGIKKVKGKLGIYLDY